MILQPSLSETVDREKRLRTPWVLAVLSALMGFASISTDLYLPALPAMTTALHAGAGSMEVTISSYLAGFSLGQLLWGPIGDRFGRRMPIVIGLVLFAIGSAGCALSTSAIEVIGWRIVQASGACAGVVLGRAMVRDLYSGERAAQMMSTLMTVMAIAPLLGPFVGGQILNFGSWQAIFWTLVAIGALTLIAVLTIPETLPAERRNHEPLSGALGEYLRLLRQPRILGFIGAGAFFYAGMFAYIAGTPFAYISFYHVPAQFYGLLFGAGILGIMATNLLNARLVVRVGGVRLMRIGTGGAAIAAVLLIFDSLAGFGGLAGVAIPLFVFVGMTGLIVANSISGAMASFPDRAGTVSALVGALQYGAGIVGSALVGALADGTPMPMAWVIGAASVGSVACAFLLIRSPTHEPRA